MRLDKYLKEMHIIKRRTVANALCDNDKVSVNGVVKKAFYEVAVGDKIAIRYGENEITHEVIKIPYERKKK
ncbi:MAG: RNA-binding S4 domain-containing protein [Lachnospiraceae bacterium]|nr:RNA-binding S4 domain-containing protein [Lachnospiraceae bacterium]